jgi:hypothetical protein
MRGSPTSNSLEGLSPATGVDDKSTEQFLRDFMDAFGVFITRVLTVLPREG